MAWKVFFAWSQTADVLCTEIQKLTEKVGGGKRVDAKRNYTTIKMFMLFVCGCYESELCLRVIRGYIHSTDSVEKHFLNRSK